MSEQDLPRIVVNRKAVDQKAFDSAHEVTNPDKASLYNRACHRVKKRLNPGCFKSSLKGLFPCYDWIRHYDVKNDLVADLICGVTIAIFQVPQSMAYAMLASVPAVYGLYSSFFPVLVYFFMGTSKQAAVGTFSLTSLMTGGIVRKWAYVPATPQPNETTEEMGFTTMQPVGNVGYDPGGLGLSPIEIATVVALLCGIYQCIFGLCRLGYLSAYLSDHLVSGFTCGAAIHVGTSQIGNIFGIQVSEFVGPLNQIYIYIDFFEKIGTTHLKTLALSGTCIVLLIFVKEFLNPRLKKFTRVPFPIELILVVFGTVASVALDLHESHNVNVVGYIKTGFPSPSVPPVRAIPKLAAESVAVAVVAFSATVSLGKIFAQRYGYEIDPNQELFAVGATNLVGCFFSCIPSAASISRSSVQDAVGGRTQLVSLIACAGLVVVLLSLGSLLSPLPICILGAIIVVALKNMLMQVKDFWRYWKVSKIDGLIWMVTFLSVFIIDVDYGLGIGVAFSLGTLIIRSQRPKVFVLGQVPSTDLYVPISRYATAREIPGTKIFHFGGPLHFGSVEYFSSTLSKVTNISTALGVREKKEDIKLENGEVIMMTNEGFEGDCNGTNGEPDKDWERGKTKLSHVIFDCSSWGFMDTSGVTTLKQIHQALGRKSIACSLVSCSPGVMKMLEKDDFFQSCPLTAVFPTIHDAVLCVKNTL